MANITYASSNGAELLNITDTPALVVVPEGEEGHRCYFDDQNRGMEQIIGMGSIVIALLVELGVYEEALLASRLYPESAEFRLPNGDVIQVRGG